MDEYADLFITLSRPTENKYLAVLSFSRSDNQAEIQPVQGEMQLDFTELRKATTAPEIGKLLRDSLFADPALKNFFNQCLVAVQSASLTPRLRLLIDRSAQELHSLRWEPLFYPDKDQFLSLDQNLCFSRFLASSDWSRIELRSKGDLHALLMVAGPNDLDEWTELPDSQLLAPVDVAGEVNRAKAVLQGIHSLAVLGNVPGADGQATWQSLQEHLQQGFDILYLVCHGVLDRSDRKKPDSPRRPYLWLEKADGTSDRVDGEKLVSCIEQLEAGRRPRLAVLISCQSAGKGIPADPRRSDDRGALAALGPRLAEVGIPAVVAMQANISMATVEQFIPEFFNKLLETGRIDLAMAFARSLVKDNHDWWVPVLFLRLRGGRLWYQTSVSGAANEFDFWQGVTSSIRDRHCTPVLGAGLLDFLAGSFHEIARDWALKHRYPLEQHSQDDLHLVAQYLASYMRVIPANFLVRYMLEKLRLRYQAILPQDILDTDLNDLEIEEQAGLLNRAISAVGENRRLSDPADPYAVLAGLPVKIYITTNPDQLLEDALRAHKLKKDPQSLYFCWKNKLNTPQNIERFTKLVEPTVKRPLVYHLFGSLEEPESLVLTEDDYFDYLMWINKSNPQIPIPTQVINAWTDNALLFLGFEMSAWPFRMLFRSILNEERQQTRSRDYDSLVVQLQPGDDNIQPDRARKYLEKFFSNEKFNIYWGSPGDFLKELHQQWNPGGNP